MVSPGAVRPFRPPSDATEFDHPHRLAVNRFTVIDTNARTRNSAAAEKPRDAVEYLELSLKIKDTTKTVQSSQYRMYTLS